MMTTPLYWHRPDLLHTECRIAGVRFPAGTGVPGLRDLVLEESPFYPGGGGQPADRGRIAGLEVEEISKKGGEVLHRVRVVPEASGRMEAGSMVRCEVDEAFRSDSMQQHSGQHLLSAALAKEGLATLSVHLGADYCGIEVDAPETDGDLPDRILRQCDRWISDDRPILSRVVDADDPAVAGLRRPLSGRVSDESGPGRPVRIVEIDGVDAVGCGGVHLTRTGAVVGILYAGSEKIRGRIRLKWIIGDRVIRQARQQAAILEEACRLLSAEVPELPVRLEALAAENRDNARRLAASESMLGALLCRQAAAGTGRMTDSTIVATEIGGGSDRMQGALEAARELNVRAALFLGEAGPDGSRPWGIHLNENAADRFNRIREHLIAPADGRGGGRYPFWRGIISGDTDELIPGFIRISGSD